ncbi:hypothetical protein ALC56_04719 [Trachymyrmex septentrionalis]|uniref:Uncharacterized protein n=1 Tax=Trachymyrmex septentrionalis TaxID=34720 RepID=A0A195FLG0_9HYME|nr:hypothetical protein ALC56_04719 [Trachymyrmex septentrionalis]
MAVVEPDRRADRGEEGNDIAPHLLRSLRHNRSIAAPVPVPEGLRHSTACLHECVMLDHWRLSSTDLVLTYGYVLPMRLYSSFSGQKFESGAYAGRYHRLTQLNEFFRNTKLFLGVNPDFAVNVASLLHLSDDILVSTVGHCYNSRSRRHSTPSIDLFLVKLHSLGFFFRPIPKFFRYKSFLENSAV